MFGEIIAFLVEPFLLLDYWSPKYLLHHWFFNGYQMGSLEDFLYGFFLGGIAAVIYEEVFGKRFIKRRDRRYSWRWFTIPFFVIGIPLFLFPILTFKINSMYAAFISICFCVAFSIYFRRDLLIDSLASGLLMGSIYLAIILLFSALFPGILNAQWKLQNLSGIFILGIPIEEPAHAFALGALLGPFYEFFAGLKFRKK